METLSVRLNQIDKKDRREMNIRRLLARCELMAEDKSRDWRFERYLIDLEEMLKENDTDQFLELKALLSYQNRLDFLKSQLTIVKIESPLEKAVISALSGKGSSDETKTIRNTTDSFIQGEIRADLFRKRRQTETDSINLMKSQPSDEMETVLKYHRDRQENLAENMIQLAQNLKEQSLTANAILRKDTEKLEKSSNMAEKNYGNLKTESDKLTEQTKTAFRWWIWALVLIVLIIFVNMVLFMKVMKKRTR